MQALSCKQLPLCASLRPGSLTRNRQKVGTFAPAATVDPLFRHLSINDAMLEAGKARADNAKWEGRLDWVCADGQNLPWADNSFDVVTVSFGIRNFADRVAGLKEFRRVLKPGGRLAVLEFSHMTAPALQAAYDTYSFNVIPQLGSLVAGDKESYQYLVESIRNFPDQETFLGMVRAAGFGQAKYRNLSMGIAALHSGWKL